MNIFSTLTLTVALAAGISIPSCLQLGGTQEEAQKRNYLSEVKSVNKLVLAQMTISKMATIDDLDITKAEGVKQMAVGLMNSVKVGDRKAPYSYDTYLRAYLDLSTLTPEDVKVDDVTQAYVWGCGDRSRI